jgi:hypothetical protein
MNQSISAAPRSASRAVLGSLARQEILAYLKHPLFLIGLVGTIAICALGPDKSSSSLFHVIVPATGLGVFGILVMAGLVHRSDATHEAAGTVVVSERTRTYALACAIVVPFTAGLGFFAWAVWAYHAQPPLAYTMPFGPVGDGWVYAVLFALGTMSAVGGPVLGLLVGRYLHFRGAAILCAVGLILATIVMQGIVEPLRYVRVFAPWTYFGGPVGVDGDPERWLIMTGSPQWYCLYLVALCALGVVVAALHDREQPRERLTRLAAALAVVALALGALAMTQGVQDEQVNPLPSPKAEGS